MKQVRWIIGILAAIALLTLATAYRAAHEQVQAYLYDPKTDRLFEVRLGWRASKLERWDLLKASIPVVSLFRPVDYHEPTYVHYLGTLDELVQAAQEEEQLKRADFHQYLELEKKRAQWRWDPIQGAAGLNSWLENHLLELTYAVNREFRAKDLARGALRDLGKLDEQSHRSYVLPVDSVLVWQTMRVETISPALLVRGKGALLVNRLACPDWPESSAYDCSFDSASESLRYAQHVRLGEGTASSDADEWQIVEERPAPMPSTSGNGR